MDSNMLYAWMNVIDENQIECVLHVIIILK